jgi:hypothetical protein
MAKKPINKAYRLNQKGQLSIFFSVTIVILITIIAFVINVGLFVKAKINLQNAVDSAAWSGASVQARQLTGISYLNWEMRNIYKEWMFKYYILGNMSINGVNNPQDGPMNFTMEKRPTGTGKDDYNFPSVCIHFANTVDVCKRYEIPGLPRFENTTLPGIDQTSANFIDSIVQKKAEDCSRRTQLNFLAALSWIYGVNGGSDTVTSQAPQIATDRPGAWPSAFETAIRIRNLEHMVNTHSFGGRDFNKGVCTNPVNSTGINCKNTISEIASSGLPHYERIVKAFFSAYRNLGNEDDDELKGSFVLTEVTPTPVKDANTFSMSNLLIKQAKDQEKYYLDLKLVTLNLINFYSAFVANDSTEGDSKSEAGCFVSKIGIPVPGYPFGFEKNQDVVTYYAVKGEANFIGLFNPFPSSYTKLTAYAAAKPMGGRIGPKLFDTKTNPTLVQGRKDPPKSAAYLSGLMFSDNVYSAGKPIPLAKTFWVNDSDQPVGGWLQEGEIRFGLPNLIYENIGDMSVHLGSERIQIIAPGNPATEPNLGLFNGQQFKLFKENFPEYDGTSTITAKDITNAIRNVRAPTHYDAQNYLIPYPNKEWDQLKVDSFGFINGDINQETGSYRFSIFAPLYQVGGNFLYNTASEIKTVLQDYLASQKTSIDTYVNALKTVGDQMRFKNPSAEGLYFKASKVINDEFYGNPLTCNSIAGTFKFFVLGEEISELTTQLNCPKPFPESLAESWSSMGGRTATGTSDAYIGEFRYNNVISNAPKPLKLFTAYAPGPYNNASSKAVVNNRFLGTRETMRRNTYSTKFISLKSVSSKNGSTYNESTSFPTFSEGNKRNSNSDTKQKNFKNPADYGAANVKIQNIRH